MVVQHEHYASHEHRDDLYRPNDALNKASYHTVITLNMDSYRFAFVGAS